MIRFQSSKSNFCCSGQDIAYEKRSRTEGHTQLLLCQSCGFALLVAEGAWYNRHIGLGIRIAFGINSILFLCIMLLLAALLLAAFQKKCDWQGGKCILLIALELNQHHPHSVVELWAIA